MSAVLKQNTIIGDKVYAAGTPLEKLPAEARGILADTMVVRTTVPAPKTDDAPKVDIYHLKLEELQKLAQERGVEVPEGATRTQIIEALKPAGQG
jgi:hypothetical protein